MDSVGDALKTNHGIHKFVIVWLGFSELMVAAEVVIQELHIMGMTVSVILDFMVIGIYVNHAIFPVAIVQEGKLINA